jgi:hypothetical protein
VTFVLRLVLNTLVLPVGPLAIAVGVALATRSAAARRSAGVVAAASGIVIAHLINVGVPRIPPVDTIGWIPFATALAALGLLVDARPALRLALAFVIAAIATRLVGKPVWHAAMDAAPWAVLVGAVTAAVAGSLDVASRRMAPAATLLAFAMTMAGGSIACLFGHSALLAQVLGATAAVVGASGVMALFVEASQTIASVAAVSAALVLVYARLYATLSTLVAALLVASAVAPVVASSLPLGRRARAVVAVAMAIALGIAAAWCARA